MKKGEHMKRGGKMKVAAITGADSGLGAALTELLAKKGWALVLGGRDEKKLNEFTDTLQKITANLFRDQPPPHLE